MYDRDVQVPRLVAHFDLADEAGAAGVPDVIGQAARLVSAQTRVAFNSVGLNFYRVPRRTGQRGPAQLAFRVRPVREFSASSSPAGYR